jgi:Sulfotransferase family
LVQNHKFVFICGLHRSGTSLLFRTLKKHPMISGFDDTGVPEDEGQHLQTIFHPAKVYGGPGEFGFDKNSYLDEDSSLVSVENANRIFNDWSRYWDVTKPVLLEKSPPNLVRSRFLQALFPNSFFLIVLRHPVAVAYSTQNWTRGAIESLIDHWLVCYERFEADRPKLRNVHELKYEDLIASPSGTLNNIFSFLDLEPYHIAMDIRPDGNQKHFQKWNTEYGKTFQHLEPRIQRFGYSLQVS